MITLTESKLALKNISHFFDGNQALSNISLDIKPGEIVSLLGPSGCGKTTLLNTIAGFLQPTRGGVFIDGVQVNHLGAGQRKLGMVFQNYALFPHMTVLQNVSYGLRARGESKERIGRAVQDVLQLVKMEDFATRYPSQLSGGQQQRVALGRVLVTQPSVLLLDEPFSALDKGLRLDMQIEVKRLLREQGLTAIIVTHDQEEALSMADRIVVLNEGCVEQVDTPAALYDRPRTLFVNSFIGQTNQIPARVQGMDGGNVLLSLAGDGSLSLPSSGSFKSGDQVIVTVRPENIQWVDLPMLNSFQVEVQLILPLGPIDVIETRTKGGISLRFQCRHAVGRQSLATGDRVHLRIEQPEMAGIFSAPMDAVATGTADASDPLQASGQRPVPVGASSD